MRSASRSAERYAVAACSTVTKPIATSTSVSRRRRNDQEATGLISLPRHHVAQPAHRADEIGAELLAQAVHVDLHRVAADVVLPAVKLLFELRLRKHHAGALQHR